MDYTYTPQQIVKDVEYINNMIIFIESHVSVVINTICCFPSCSRRGCSHPASHVPYSHSHPISVSTAVWKWLLNMYQWLYRSSVLHLCISICHKFIDNFLFMQAIPFSASTRICVIQKKLWYLCLQKAIELHESYNRVTMCYELWICIFWPKQYKHRSVIN